jgi:hypothetical protein
VVILTAISTAEEGNDCTFNLTKNDSTGLTGDLHCDTAVAADVNSGARKTVQVTAQWDAHP